MGGVSGSDPGLELVGAILLKQNDKRSPNRCSMQLEGLQTLSDTVSARLSAVAR
jgi:hypothetical protein